MAVLSVNAGSSSLKFALYPLDSDALGEPLLIGQFERLEAWDVSKDHHAAPPRIATLKYNLLGKAFITREIPLTQERDPFDSAINVLKSLIDESLGQMDNLTRSLTAISHRVVHGGYLFKSSVVVTNEVLAQLSALNSLAPLHQPHNLKGVQVFMKAFPHLPQVLCFDTAYHSSIPSVETALALPPSLTEKNIKKYACITGNLKLIKYLGNSLSKIHIQYCVS